MSFCKKKKKIIYSQYKKEAFNYDVLFHFFSRPNELFLISTETNENITIISTIIISLFPEVFPIIRN